MRVTSVLKTKSSIRSHQDAVVRVEIPLTETDPPVIGETGRIIILDAEDTLDIIIEDADGDRECIQSWLKDVPT